MALTNVEESDAEIIPSSCSYTFIGKPNEELKLLKDHSSVHSSGKKERIVAAHSYHNYSLRSKKRMKKKSFSFINEFSQNLSQNQETEIFWSLPTLANKTNYTPTKDNKETKNNNSSGTYSFEGESSPPATNSDSCIYVNNNKKHTFNADINNFSSRFLSLSPLKKTCKKRIDDRKLYTEASAANLGNEVSESPSEVLFKKRKPKSKEHSGEFQSPEILSQNAVLEIENKNSCILNNVIAESAPLFSCDLFDSNLVTVPITEELHTVKGKLSPFKGKKENKRKEIMLNNVEALSSHQILTNEINGVINHQNSKTIIELESDSKKLEDKKSNDARFSPEKCSEYDNSTKKQHKKKLKDVASNEVHSRPEKVNGFDNSPKKLRNKKVDDISDGYTSPEKVNGWDNSPKKLRNKKVDDVSDGYTSPEKVNRWDNSPKKILNKKVDDVSDGYTSPEKVNGSDNSPKKLRNKKVDDISDGYTSPEKVNGWDNSPKKLRNKKVDDVRDGYTSPKKVNGCDNSPKKLRNKKVYDVSDGYTSPEKVNRWDNSPKKIQNKKVGDDHFSPKKSSGYNDISTPEKVIGYDSSPTKLQKKKEKDETSSDDHSSVEKVNRCDRSPNKALNKKHYNRTSGEVLSSPETVAEDDKPMKKQRKKKLGVVIANDDHPDPEIIDLSCLEKRDENYNGVKKQCCVNLKDGGSKEGNSSLESDNENPIKNLRNPKMMSTSSTGYHCRPKIVSETEYSTKKQRHSKLVNKILTDDHSSPDKVAETDHALRVQRNIRSKNKRSIDQYSRPEIVSESEYKTKKQRKSEQMDSASSNCRSSLENNVNERDSALREQSNIMSNKRSIGHDSTPEIVSEFEGRTKKQRNSEQVGKTSTDRHSRPDNNVNESDSALREQSNKLKNRRIDQYSSPEIVSEFEDRTKKQRNNEQVGKTSTDRHSRPDDNVNESDSVLREQSNKLKNRRIGQYSSPEIVSEFEDRTKKQRNNEQVGKTSTDRHSRPDNNVNESDSALREQSNKRLIDHDSTPEIVSEFEGRTKKQRNSEQVGKTSTHRHTRPDNNVNESDSALREQSNKLKNRRIDQYSSPEIVSEFEDRTKKQRNNEQVGKTSTDRHSRPDNNVNESDSALREQSNKLKNRRIDQYSSPEIVSEFEDRTKKQRNNEQVGKTSTDRHSRPDNNVNESDSALREQSNIMSNKRSIDQYSSPEFVSEFEDRTKKQRNNELVERTSTDHHSSLDKKVNGNVNTTKKQRRRSGIPLERTSNDDQTGTDGVKDIILCNSEGEINDFRLILLKEDIPLTDKEIYYLHRKLAKAYTLSEELCTKLKNLDIKITWKLSEFHRDYKFIHNGEFSYADKSDLRHTKLKEGAFETEENEAIKNRWETFCKMYNFNAFKDFRGFLPRSYDHKKPHPLPKYEKLKFVQFLGKDLPDRLLHTVYARFIELFKNYFKGRFSTEEDEWLLIFKKYSRNRSIYSILSSLLHRSRYTIYKRMKRLINFYGDLEAPDFRDNFSKNRNENNIDPQEENELRVSPCSSSRCYDNETLRKTIAHLTGSEDIQKWDSFTANISCWRRIGKKCKIPPVEAKLQYLCNLRIKSLPHKIPQTSCLLMRIIHRLKKYRWKKWGSINWNLLSEELFHLGPVFLYVTFRRYVKNSVPSEFWGKLTDCLNYIEQNDKDLQNEDISD